MKEDESGSLLTQGDTPFQKKMNPNRPEARTMFTYRACHDFVRILGVL